MATVAIRVTANLKLDEVSAKALARIDAATEKAAFDTEATAKSIAPVDTGLLRNSINFHKLGFAWFEVVSPVFYSLFVELGTSRAAAQPFMHPAAERVKPSWVRAIQKATA